MDVVEYRLYTEQPPDFGWRAADAIEALRLHKLWLWHNEQGRWTNEESAFPEEAD